MQTVERKDDRCLLIDPALKLSNKTGCFICREKRPLRFSNAIRKRIEKGEARVRNFIFLGNWGLYRDW